MTVRGLMTILLVDILLPVAVVFNIYLYFYPVLFSCDFPRTTTDHRADFRLLTIADPQIEGDTTLRRFKFIERTAEELDAQPLQERITDLYANTKTSVRYYGKVLDLWGNDRYLKHMYKTVKKHTDPTHVTVLGDLLGSQWISDEEFERRGNRFWEIFDDGEKVTPEDIRAQSADGPAWRNKILTMPGNHDIGYAGDMNRHRIERFEKMFGPANYKLHFHPGPEAVPELRLVVLNSLALDTPVFDQSVANDAYEAVDEVLKNKSLIASQATVLLTHLPFWKPEGVCVDGPMMDFFPEEYGGGVKSQNFLSDIVSHLLKGWIFGYPGGDDPEVKGKSRGVVLTGHDHEGCDTTHWWNTTTSEGAAHGKWNVSRTADWRGEEMKDIIATKEAATDDKTESIREITVRSIMGMYGGNIGLLSAWYDWGNEEWKFEYGHCAMGVQHIWWAVHGTNFGIAVYIVILALIYAGSALSSTKPPAVHKEKKTN